MSKVGSDKNIGKFDCSWLIIPFSEGATPAEKPEETLAKAQRSEDEILKPYNITPAPDYKQNAGYEDTYKAKCVDTHGIDFAAEKAQSYWYHSDHLGSASYITGADGKVCSNINYFPTGEVFVEQNRNSPNLPYKFNGKELDSETGYYYYGARYYNPKVSLWLNVDPLADYNPHMNDEHYKDGEHNGGVFNQMNNNPYIYCYQSPVRYIDPNGKQVDSNATASATIVYAPAYRSAPVIETPWFDKISTVVGTLGVRLLCRSLIFMPGTLSAPAPIPRTYNFDPARFKSIDLPVTIPKDKTKDDSGVELYRGVSSDYRTKVKRDMYNYAKFGTAIPLGNEGGHDDPDRHAQGNNESIYTSWTTNRSTAEKFAKGPGGKYPGVILSKKFKYGEAFPNLSPTANRLKEGEWLVPGVVNGAKVEKLKK
jgi:RHS repeat-associated protein